MASALFLSKVQNGAERQRHASSLPAVRCIWPIGSGLECDAIVHLRNGPYGLVEVKLGGETLIAEGAETLNALAEKIDQVRMKPPSFKMVVVATGEFAYRRKEDDVIVCPISALKP